MSKSIRTPLRRVRDSKIEFEFELDTASHDGLPPFRAQAGGRARNLGEAGSAELAQRASTGRWGQPQADAGQKPAEGSNPSLSANKI